jgi:S1-C subfamily serine protease
MWRRLRATTVSGARAWFATALLSGALTACGQVPDSVSTRTSELVYGADDRLEWFEYAGLTPTARIAVDAVVAVGVKADLDESRNPWVVKSPSWQERDGLCANQRFGDQPSFAFCTGVALAPNLVLTAGHCANAFALSEVAVVAGFAYDAPGQLRPLSPDGVRGVSEVVASDSYLDYAWLRLTADLPVRPAVFGPGPEPGARVVSVNHGGGVPMKVDPGGTVYAVDSESFVSSVDAFAGASGSPVFSDAGELLGVLTAGADDYVVAETGCLLPVALPDAKETAREEAVRVDVAAAGLCTDHPDEAPCAQLSGAPHPSTGGGGCSTVPTGGAPEWPASLIALISLSRLRTRRCGSPEPDKGRGPSIKA